VTRLIIPILVALAIVGTAPSSWAEDEDRLSGNYWLDKCSSTEPHMELYCLGFTEGLSEALALLERSYIKDGDDYKKYAPFCVPKEANLGQRMDIFLKYLQDHPEKRHKRASVIFAVATREAFCE